MSYRKITVEPSLQERLTASGLGTRKTVLIRQESLDHFITSLRHSYPKWTREQLCNEAIICCLTHPLHRELHQTKQQKALKRWPWFVAIFVIIILGLIFATRAHAQQSQIDVITFKTSTGTVVRTFASPFTIKAGTGVTFGASGPVLTINSSGGGASGGYATIQNGGVAIAAETALNFLGSFSCVDNPGNASSDCQLTASAAVSHQFVTGVDASGNYLRAAILAADVPTLNQSTTGNAATASAFDHTPTLCSAGNFPLGITATGAATGCTAAGGGSGTVTNVAVSAPLGGGPITTTGTLTCASCVVATTPGVGIAHFAGATQAVTSSPVTSADTTGTFTATAHALLSTTHSDTTASAAVRGGGLFVIGATPTWTQLAHGAATGSYFKWNGTDEVASTGAASGTGACTNQFASTLNADAAPTCTSVTQATMAAGAINWAFCGTTNGAVSELTVVNASTCCNGTTCREFMLHYLIVGYSAGAVGRLLMGPGTPSTTAATNGSGLREVTTATATDVSTAAVSIPGIPLAITVTAIARDGWIMIDGASGSLKSININGLDGNPSVSAAPTIFQGVGWFSDLSTNLPLQQFTLGVYATLATTALAATTFAAGTRLDVWGRNGN